MSEELGCVVCWVGPQPLQFDNYRVLVGLTVETLAPVLAWKRPSVEVESRVVHLDRRRLPLAVTTEESESVDIVRESRQRVVIVVAGDTDERDICVSKEGGRPLDHSVGLCVSSLAIH